MRLIGIAALLAALFVVAFVLGRSGEGDAPGLTGPELQHETAGISPRVSPPPDSAALPRLRPPAPEPTPATPPPASTEPISPTVPVTPTLPTTPTSPAPSTGGSGGGGDGGGVIISG